MERHSNRLTLLVDDVLSLARLEGPGASLDFTTIRPAAFLGGMMRDWEKQFAARNLTAHLEASDDLPPLQVDEARLQEVIYNLLENAVKYSNDGGRVEVRATREDEAICFSVTDHGIGIPARDLPRIFERFFRADKSRQRDRGGTGLGLAIVKHIAQLHGGHVTAESAPGAGTTVRVYLRSSPNRNVATRARALYSAPDDCAETYPRTFDEALANLRNNVLMMASPGHAQPREFLNGLQQRDDDLCATAIADDEEVDQLEKQVDSDGIDLLLRFQPVASDPAARGIDETLLGTRAGWPTRLVNIARKAWKLNRHPALPRKPI